MVGIGVSTSKGGYRMRLRISRFGVQQALCLAIGVVLAYDVPWFVEAWRVIPPFLMEVFRCVEKALR